MQPSPPRDSTKRITSQMVVTEGCWHREICASRLGRRSPEIGQPRGATRCNRAEPMPELARWWADGV